MTNPRPSARANSGALEVAKKSVARTSAKHAKTASKGDMWYETGDKLNEALSKQAKLRKKQKSLRDAAQKGFSKGGVVKKACKTCGKTNCKC